MLSQRSLTIVTVSLLTLGFAVAAQAGPRLYAGTLIIEAFGEEDGTTAAFTTKLPLGVPGANAHCNTNTFHAKETRTLQTYYTTNTASGWTNGNYNTLTIPSYAGQVAVHQSGSEWFPDGCGPESLAYGAPLAGQGSIHTTGATSTLRASSNPRGFTLIASDLYGVEDGGSLSYRLPLVFAKRYADLRNRRGEFCAGCGPGRYSSSLRFSFEGTDRDPRDHVDGRLGVTPGENKFGGTMRLLGTVYMHTGHKSVYDTYLYKRTWLFDYVGAGAYMTGGTITAPAFGQDYNHYMGRHAGFSGTTTVQAFALSWTTGTVTITAAQRSGFEGGRRAFMERAGFDNRDSNGYGDIQMVSPMLTRWIGWNGRAISHSGGIGILRLRFTPEPQVWMLLGAGLSLLGLLYRANRRSR